MAGSLSVYRSELKYIMNYADASRLKTRLDAFLRSDAHAEDGAYRVKSLYFDTPYNRDFQEKLDGMERRQKLRLRIYDESQPTAKMELKSKNGNYQHKISLEVSKADALELARGNYTPLFQYSGDAAMRLYTMLTMYAYRPAAIIEYNRTAFSYPEFDVRLTFDSQIRSSELNLDLYNPALPWNPVFTDAIILEVKFNEHLPGFIQKILAPYRLTATSFSKYCVGRPFAGGFL